MITLFGWKRCSIITSTTAALVADDHTLVTTALTEMLGIYSMRTITVQNAAETLEKPNCCSLLCS